MRKLMAVLTIVFLVVGTGSVVMRDGGRENTVQGMCRAPDTWIRSVLSEVPQVPAFIERQEQAIEALAPGVASFIDGLPAGKGSLLEKWILTASPRYL